MYNHVCVWCCNYSTCNSLLSSVLHVYIHHEFLCEPMQCVCVCVYVCTHAPASLKHVGKRLCQLPTRSGLFHSQPDLVYFTVYQIWSISLSTRSGLIHRLPDMVYFTVCKTWCSRPQGLLIANQFIFLPPFLFPSPTKQHCSLYPATYSLE